MFVNIFNRLVKKIGCSISFLGGGVYLLLSDKDPIITHTDIQLRFPL